MLNKVNLDKFQDLGQFLYIERYFFFIWPNIWQLRLEFKCFVDIMIYNLQKKNSGFSNDSSL